MDGIEFWTTLKKGLRPLSHIAHLNSSNCSHLIQYIFSHYFCIFFFYLLVMGPWVFRKSLNFGIKINLHLLNMCKTKAHLSLSYNIQTPTSSKTLATTCLSRIGTYLVLWGTMVGDRTSRMVSFLATRPFLMSHILDDISLDLKIETIC